MAQRCIRALALVPFAAADFGGDTPDMSNIQGKCYSLLQGMSASPYSQAELFMLCRAKLPVDVCRSTAEDLGEKPWSPSTIGRTCGMWEEQWAVRMLMVSPEEREQALEDWEAQVDDIMKKKSAVGVCTNKTVDECVVYKREEYPKYTKQLNDAMKDKHDQWTGHSGATERAVIDEELRPSADGKFEVVHLRGRKISGIDIQPALCVVGGAAVVGLAAAILAMRRSRHRLSASILFESDAEEQSQHS